MFSHIYTSRQCTNTEQIKGLQYQMWRTKMMMLDVDPKQKKKRGAEYFQLPEHIDQEWVKAHQEHLLEEQRTKIEKKFQKDNEKLQAEKQPPLAQSELKDRLQVIKELEAKFKKENKTNKVEAEGRGPTVEKLETAVTKLEERIRVLETQKEDRDGNKEVALGTSKIVSST
jgi:DNA topoisomerase I